MPDAINPEVTEPIQILPFSQNGGFKIRWFYDIEEEVRMELINSSGELILHKIFFGKGNSEFVISLKDLPKGLYILSFKTKSKPIWYHKLQKR